LDREVFFVKNDILKSQIQNFFEKSIKNIFEQKILNLTFQNVVFDEKNLPVQSKTYKKHKKYIKKNQIYPLKIVNNV
jgi:selenophosphate synthetase-related protein